MPVLVEAAASHQPCSALPPAVCLCAACGDLPLQCLSGRILLLHWSLRVDRQGGVGTGVEGCWPGAGSDPGTGGNGSGAAGGGAASWPQIRGLGGSGV